MWMALRSATQEDGRGARFHPATLRRVVALAADGRCAELYRTQFADEAPEDDGRKAA